MSTWRRTFHNLRAYLRRTVSTACGRSMVLASSKARINEQQIILPLAALFLAENSSNARLLRSFLLCNLNWSYIGGIAVSYRTER